MSGHKDRRGRRERSPASPPSLLVEVVPGVSVRRVPGRALDIAAGGELIAWVEEKDPGRLIDNDLLGLLHVSDACRLVGRGEVFVDELVDVLVLEARIVDHRMAVQPKIGD